EMLRSVLASCTHCLLDAQRVSLDDIGTGQASALFMVCIPDIANAGQLTVRGVLGEGRRCQNMAICVVPSGKFATVARVEKPQASASQQRAAGRSSRTCTPPTAAPAAPTKAPPSPT